MKIQITKDSNGTYSLDDNEAEFITADFVVDAEAHASFIQEYQYVQEKWDALQEKLSDMWEENR